MAPKNQQLLRLTYEEMLYVEAVLSIAINVGTKPTKRLQIVTSAHKKIFDAMEQAVKDGLFDPDKIKI